MDFMNSNPMPVADHFMTIGLSYGDERRADDETVAGEVCERCYEYCAAGKTELWRHARDRHGADSRLRCPAPGCGRRFFAVAMCAAHASHHRAGPRPLTCELCGRLLRNRSTFEKHVVKMHPEARDSVCGVCHAYEGDVRSLVEHVRRRHGADIESEVSTTVDDRIRRVIRCDVCGKRYGNNRNMRVHRRMHGEDYGRGRGDDEV